MAPVELEVVCRAVYASANVVASGHPAMQTLRALARHAPLEFYLPMFPEHDQRVTAAAKAVWQEFQECKVGSCGVYNHTSSRKRATAGGHS